MKSLANFVRTAIDEYNDYEHNQSTSSATLKVHSKSISDRDTEKEFDSFQTSYLVKKKCGRYPIFWLLRNTFFKFNLKAEPFVYPVICGAGMGMELGRFEEEDRIVEG